MCMLSKPTKARVRRLFLESSDKIALEYSIQDGSRDDAIAHGEEEISMMTSRTYREHVAKWQPSAAMRGVVYGPVWLCHPSIL